MTSTAEYCKRSCGNACQKSKDSAAVAGCVIDRVAQPNSVKCTRSDTENAKSRTTPTMNANCANHLVRELLIMRPHLVVFHGVEARQHVPKAFTAIGVAVEPMVGSAAACGPVLHTVPQMAGNLLFLHHPSYQHLDRQWNSVVLPALGFLRAAKLIPE